MLLTEIIKLNPSKKVRKVLWNISDISTCFYNDLVYYNKINRYKKKENGKKFSFNCYEISNLLPECKKIDPRLNILYAKCLQQIIKRYGKNLKSFFALRKIDKKARPPKFKSKEEFFTLNYNQAGFKVNSSNIILSHGSENDNKHHNIILNFHRNMRQHIADNIEIIKQVEILYYDENFWAHITYVPKIPLNYSPQDNSTLFCDPGVQTLLTGFDGKRVIKVSSKPLIKRNKYFAKQKKYLKSKIDNCEKGSRNQQKLKRVLNKIQRKNNSQIDQVCHSLSKELAKIYSNFVIGDWTTKQSITDIKAINRVVQNYLPLSKFIQFLAYKAKNLEQKDESGTTKYCLCGNKVDISVSERTFYCDKCDLISDRDIKSSISLYMRWNLAGVTQPPDIEQVKLLNIGCNQMSFSFHGKNKVVWKSTHQSQYWL
ncbi:MAG TPA: transposase [Candidatus Lokiarchaeia archaeon]